MQRLVWPVLLCAAFLGGASGGAPESADLDLAPLTSRRHALLTGAGAGAAEGEEGAALLRLLPELLPAPPVCHRDAAGLFHGESTHSRPFLEHVCGRRRQLDRLIQLAEQQPQQLQQQQQSLPQLQPLSQLHTMTLEDETVSDEEEETSYADEEAEPLSAEPEWAYELAGWLAPMHPWVRNKQCRQHSRAYLDQLNKAQQWALQMFDSSGKVPDGFFYGNNNMLGLWDECLNVEATLNSTEYPNVTETSFKGQYCLAYIMSSAGVSEPKDGLGVVPILPVPAAASVGSASAPLRYGYCVPSSCTPDDVTLSLNLWLRTLNSSALIGYAVDCQTIDQEHQTLETNDIVVIVILAIFGVVIATCTTLDIVGLYMRKGVGSPDATIIGQPSPFPPADWRIVSAFSLRYNGLKLLNTAGGSDNLGCIHGMRFLSMTWVVLGHNYIMAVYNGAWTNVAYLADELIQPAAMEVIMNALLSVDTFFCLGGIMTAYTFMRTVAANGGKVRWHDVPMMYLHRYLRLTPVYAIVIALTATLGRRIGEGPMIFPTMKAGADECQKHWWKNLLYINNFGIDNLGAMCVGQSWYLPVDFQLFLLSPFMIIPFVYNKKIGSAWLALLAATTVAIPAAVTYKEDLPPTLLFFNANAQKLQGDFFTDFYIATWCRASPYVVGICMGLLLYYIKANKVTIKIPLSMNVAVWAVMAGSGLAIVYGTHHWNKDVAATWTTAAAVSYGSLHRLAWAVCCCWVVFACVTGYGGFVDTILSFKGFVPLGRLTYTTYLVSLQIQTWYFASYKGASRIGNTIMVYTFLSNLIISLTFAAVLSLCFESPMMMIEKMIFPQRRLKTAPSAAPPKAEPENGAVVAEPEKASPTKEDDAIQADISASPDVAFENSQTTQETPHEASTKF